MKHLRLFILCGLMCLGIFSGMYRYALRGIVSEHTIGAIQEKCSRFQKNAHVTCLRRELRAIMRITNIHDIMRAVLVDSYHAEDAQTVYNSPNCHALAHIVGETAGAQSRQSVAQLFGMCGTSCVYGCVHGMFSGLLKKGILTKSTIATVCDSDIGSHASQRDREECIHGIGHGLADYLYSDTPAAIEYCEGFVALSDRKMCWDGVFMQVYGPVVSPERALVLTADIFADCRRYSLDVRRACMQSALSVRVGIARDIGFATGSCEDSLNDLDQCIGDIDGEQSIDTLSEQRIYARCTLAEKNVYSCVDRFVSTSRDTDRMLPVEEVCDINGIVYRDECHAYIRKKLLARGSV